MILDIGPAFEGGNKGLTVFPHPDGFMVSVKSPMGGFSIGYGVTPAEGLHRALNPLPKPCDDILGDLL